MTETLPHDALSQILDHVDDPSDILNVALCNKFFYSVAVPQHLHYRDIRSRLQNHSLWTWLSRVDDLRASQIRSLTLLPDQESDFYHLSNALYDLRERLPSDFTPDQPIPLVAFRDADECRMLELALLLALKRMTRLQKVRWYRLPRPLLQDTDDFSIWTTLQNLGTVKELDLYDGEESEIVDTHSFIHSEKVRPF